MGKIGRDLRAIRRRDPACKSWLEAVLLYPGFYALLFYRLAHLFYRIRFYFFARLLSQLARFLTGTEIHPGAKIGGGVFIDHAAAVVVGETAEIGDDCTLYQGVTLGGTGKNTGKRHPTLGRDVLVGAGAKVLGPVNIGDGAKIAAGAVVLHDIPPFATAVGVPARVVRIANKKIDLCHNDDLDQINIPDLTAQELCRLTVQLEKLQKRVEELEGEKPQA
ncbi:MAG: serine O-acetyltransferase EpsC [Oscillospiraceae bacterium]|nr:serine O-acetyltransferase EpsC [Oscillospiraceae bacterium]